MPGTIDSDVVEDIAGTTAPVQVPVPHPSSLFVPKVLNANELPLLRTN